MIDYPKLVFTVVRLYAAQTSRVAVVVREDDGRVQRLKVEHNDRVLVECRLRFHDQR